MGNALKDENEKTGEINQEIPTVSTLLKRKKITDTTSLIKKTGETKLNTISIKTPIPNHTKSNVIPIKDPEVPVPTTETMQLDMSQLNKASSGLKQKTITNIPVITPESIAVELESQKINYNRQTQGVPVFNKTLELEKLDIKSFSKNVKASKSLALRKLDCLGYLHTKFSEIAYFETFIPGQLTGKVGFGNSKLVTGIKTNQMNAQNYPGIFTLLSKNESKVQNSTEFNQSDITEIQQIGFKSTKNLGIFPVSYEDQIIGVWVCTSDNDVKIDEKELKTVSKVFSDLVL